MFMTGGASEGFASDAGGGGGAVITRLAAAGSPAPPVREPEEADAAEPAADGASAAGRDVMGVDEGADGMRAVAPPEEAALDDFPSVRNVMRDESPASMRGLAGAVGVGMAAGTSGAAPAWGGSASAEPAAGAGVAVAAVDEAAATAAGLASAGTLTPDAREAVDATADDAAAVSEAAAEALGVVAPAAPADGPATTSGDFSAGFSGVRAAGCSTGCVVVFLVARLAIVRGTEESADSDDSAAVESGEVACDDAADFAAFVAFPLLARGSVSTALDDASGASSMTAVALPASAAACAAPANHSRTVSARPTETGERWLTMSGISSAWQRATMSLELTPSSLASW
jgi:hypothetical protein